MFDDEVRLVMEDRHELIGGDKRPRLRPRDSWHNGDASCKGSPGALNQDPNVRVVILQQAQPQDE
jgi:hypothetical protein